MTLETLPPEIVSDICGYIDARSLSLVNKRLRAITLRFILSDLNLAFPSNEFEAISELLRQSNNDRHVRALILDTEQPSVDHERQLVAFIRYLTGLRFLQCQEGIALSLLAVSNSEPQFKLSVRGFQMFRESRDYRTDSLLTASCLTSLECYVGVREREQGAVYQQFDAVDLDLDGESMEFEVPSLYLAKAVGFLTRVAPNLRKLDLTQNWRYGSTEKPERPVKSAKLVHLNLSGLHNPQPIFFKYLYKSIDFEVLQSLSLPDLNYLSKAWLKKYILPLPRLEELKLSDLSQYNFNLHQPESHTDLERKILSNCPYLKKLEVLGGYNYILKNRLGLHTELESLTLHEKRHSFSAGFTYSIERDLLHDIHRCRNLTFLDIEVHRSRKDSEIWRILQDSSVTTLVLLLDCSTNSHRTAHVDGEELLKCAATDEVLARSIYDFCGLESLTVTTTPARVKTPSSPDWDTFKAILYELTGSYKVTKIEGRVHVAELARELEPLNEDNFKLDADIMGVFRGIWPSKNADWRDDWYSLPLFEEDV